MQQMSYRNAVTFNVPDDWVEDVDLEDESGLYYEDVEDAGILRLSLFTVQNPNQVTSDMLSQVLDAMSNSKTKKLEVLKNGNALFELHHQSAAGGRFAGDFVRVDCRQSPSAAPCPHRQLQLHDGSRRCPERENAKRRRHAGKLHSERRVRCRITPQSRIKKGSQNNMNMRHRLLPCLLLVSAAVSFDMPLRFCPKTTGRTPGGFGYRAGQVPCHQRRNCCFPTTSAARSMTNAGIKSWTLSCSRMAH